MGMEGKGIVVRRSKISYLYNYLLIGLVAFLFVLSWFGLDLTFGFSTSSEIWKSIVILVFVGVIAFLFEEPTIDRWFRYYLITNSEIILTEGILRKNRIIIPYQSISNVDVYKGVPGRIFNFGDVTIVGFKNQVFMKGIRDPEVFYRIINNKISIMQGTKQVVAREKIKPKKKPKKAKGWHDREKALRKELEKKEKRETKETKEKSRKKKRRLSLRVLRIKKPREEQETESEE